MNGINILCCHGNNDWMTITKVNTCITSDQCRVESRKITASSSLTAVSLLLDIRWKDGSRLSSIFPSDVQLVALCQHCTQYQQTLYLDKRFCTIHTYSTLNLNWQSAEHHSLPVPASSASSMRVRVSASVEAVGSRWERAFSVFAGPEREQE